MGMPVRFSLGVAGSVFVAVMFIMYVAVGMIKRCMIMCEAVPL